MVVRVVVVDDMPSIRERLRITCELEEGVSVIGGGEDGLEAVDLAERLQPDVIVLDQDMPVVDGLSAIPLIRRVAPATRIVVFSGLDGLAEQVLAAGADAFVGKHRPLEEVLQLLDPGGGPGGPPAVDQGAGGCG